MSVGKMSLGKMSGGKMSGGIKMRQLFANFYW